MGYSWAWLPDPLGALWARIEVLPDPPGATWDSIDVREHVAMATRFPLMRRPAIDPADGRGQKASEAAQSVALLHDAGGISQNELVRLLYGLEPTSTVREHSPRADAARKQVRRDLTAGRQWLVRQKVLPWLVFDGGNPPTGWWGHDQFIAMLAQWQNDAEREPVEREPDSLDECFKRAELVEAERLIRNRFSATALDAKADR